MGLSDKARSQVFVRDHAICSFSGKGLWILDHGATPFWQMDWPDHIHPASRGGSDSVDNLVCASYFYNSKKSNNSKDSTYLFYAGKPTSDFSSVFGELSREVMKNISRYSGLHQSDWYFNRALANVLVNLQDRFLDCERTMHRGRKYWCKSAWQRLRTWKRFADESEVKPFEKRGLVAKKPSLDVSAMLSLRDAESVDDVLDTANEIYSYYRASCSAWNKFVRARGHDKRCRQVESAVASVKVSPVVIRAMRKNLPLLQKVAGPMVVEV